MSDRPLRGNWGPLMKTTTRLALGAGTLLTFSALGLVAPAQAGVAVHCPTTGGTKYEVNAGPTYDANLPEGTRVCIKAGTQITWDTADADGVIENHELMNPTKNAFLGISYYVVYECDTQYGG